MNSALRLGLIFCALTMTACAKIKAVDIHPQFQKYVNAFVQKSHEQGTPVVIDNLILHPTDKIRDKVLGFCYLSEGEMTPPEIRISSYYWEKLTESAREELIFHELGHCILKRKHRVDENNGIPLSVMNPYIFSGSIYQVNYQHYMHELFHGRDLHTALPLAYYNPIVPPLASAAFSKSSTVADSFFEGTNETASLLTEDDLASFSCNNNEVHGH